MKNKLATSLAEQESTGLVKQETTWPHASSASRPRTAPIEHELGAVLAGRALRCGGDES
jgi:hypothetical protein